jgi:uncharacterized protein (TIGR02302 family)
MMNGRIPAYTRLLIFARLVLWWEQLWPRLWPPLGVMGLFLALALMDAFAALSGWVHSLLLGLFLVALIAALTHAMRGFRPVDRLSARKRLERDSGLVHRPLAALEDTLTGGSGDWTAETLWRAHLHRARRAAGRLSLRGPRAGLAPVDPWGLRAFVVLLVVIGLGMGRGDAPERLRTAFIPVFGGAPTVPPSLELWITPPTYTRQAPQFFTLSEPGSGELTVPERSGLLAHVANTEGTPLLRLGETTVAFDGVGVEGSGRNYQIETLIESGDRLAVEVDRDVLAAWHLQVIRDAAPTAAFIGTPAGDERAHLRIPFEAADDYGLHSLRAVITPLDERLPEAARESLSLDLPLSGTQPKRSRGESSSDLTAHLWAGLSVRIHLEARDGADQTGLSDPLEVVLPERTFRHPVAREIVAERKRLLNGNDETRRSVAGGLSRIMEWPERFAGDTVVFLALAMSRSRLLHDRRDKAIDAVRQLLWDTALRLEDGTVSIAERDLRRLEEQVERALREGADPQEIQELMAELQRALDEFLAAVMEELMRQGFTEAPPMGDTEAMEARELRDLAREIRELAEAGAMDAARQRLAELRQMLEQLRNAIAQSRNARPNQASEAQKLMQQLRDLAQRQQELLNRSFQRQRADQEGRPGDRSDQPRQGEQQGQGSPEDAALQEALRRELGDLMLDIDRLVGQIPQNLGEAERAMRRAVDALTLGQSEESVDAQTEALDKLRQGSQQTAQQMGRQMGLGFGLTRGRQPFSPGNELRRDPFGRQRGAPSGMDTRQVKVPDRGETQRAHEILEELRRRAGERQRPRLELDYIDRLLKRF